MTRINFILWCGILGAGITIPTALMAQAPSKGADWPQFRGPNRDNHSADKNLLQKWPSEGPKLLWKAQGVGQGFSSVSVVGKQVFTMGDRGADCMLFCLSRDDGKILWSTRVGASGGNYAGPRCSPTVDGDRVYALGQFGDLVCADVKNGKVVWRKNFERDFSGRAGGWNFSESPLVDGDLLICTPGGASASMVALKKGDGAVVWRCPANVVAGYSSIVKFNGAGVKQYVTLTEGGTIGVRASDGKLLWHYKRLAPNTANIPTPIVLGEQIFTCAGYGKGGALLSFSGSGDELEVKEEYFKRQLNNKHGGVVAVEQYIFADTDDSGRPFCAEWKTGKILWTRDTDTGRGQQSAAITYADGSLYVRYQNGWVSLVPASSDGYKETGSFKIPNSDTNSWPHLVVVGGRLFIREKDVIWCYDVSRPAG
ncbi:MAG: PQQ-binding-like beta-propeller repeat protein [Gemmataceae bacterium]